MYITENIISLYLLNLYILDARPKNDRTKVYHGESIAFLITSMQEKEVRQRDRICEGAHPQGTQAGGGQRGKENGACTASVHHRRMHRRDAAVAVAAASASRVFEGVDLPHSVRI